MRAVDPDPGRAAIAILAAVAQIETRPNQAIRYERAYPVDALDHIRGISEPEATRWLAENWCDRLCDPLRLFQHHGKRIAVRNGRHRLGAARALGIEALPAIVFVDLREARDVGVQTPAP